jgi:glycosyltransferase involved in cell wall biosynthesis
LDTLVDVVLATHARPHTIGYAIASVLAQTEPRFALHVVGDGCDERTAAMVAAVGDPRVRFLRFPKAPGFGYANRNVVLERVRSPFVAYMTDDDLWFPDHLESALFALGERRLDLVAFRSGQVRPPDQPDPHFFAFDWSFGPFSRFLRHWFMGAVGSVHRRSVFETVGYWNDALFRFGDREFYNRVRVSALPSAYLDHITVLRFYAQHWDGLYARVNEPPQKRYLPRVLDPAWTAAFRASARAGGRGLAVRRRQAADFAAFAVRSGPRFVRFGWQRMRWPVVQPRPASEA